MGERSAAGERSATRGEPRGRMARTAAQRQTAWCEMAGPRARRAGVEAEHKALLQEEAARRQRALERAIHLSVAVRARDVNEMVAADGENGMGLFEYGGMARLPARLVEQRPVLLCLFAAALGAASARDALGRAGRAAAPAV